VNIREKLIMLAQEGASYKDLATTYHIWQMESGKKYESVCDGCHGAITIADSIYPDSLRHLNKPPVVLFYEGNILLLNKMPKVAIVGTRKATSYGMSVAEKLGYTLVNAGVPVVSGLARGIDVASQRYAADRGLAIAVLGNGLDIYYPYKNKVIQDTIAEKGLLISEYPGEVRGTKWSYVARNRIIAALSSLVIVVESPERGGSIHTAEFAMELGVPVAAVPGDIFRITSRGTNALIADGAMIITKPEDVLSMINVVAYTNDKHGLVDILREHGGIMNISVLRGYYDSTGSLMKDIAYLEMKQIVKMEGSVVILIE